MEIRYINLKAPKFLVRDINKEGRGLALVSRTLCDDEWFLFEVDEREPQYRYVFSRNNGVDGNSLALSFDELEAVKLGIDELYTIALMEEHGKKSS